MKTETLDPLGVCLSDKIQAGLQQDERRCSVPLPPSPGQLGSEAGSEREQTCERGTYGGQWLLLALTPFNPHQGSEKATPEKNSMESHIHCPWAASSQRTNVQ